MTTATTEGEDMAATEEGIARGEFSGGILHNFIVHCLLLCVSYVT
jgi:hypothetical protein